MKLKRLLIYAMAKNNSHFAAIYLLLFRTKDFYKNNFEQNTIMLRSSQIEGLVALSKNKI